MYSLTRVSSSVGIKPGYILPKPSLLMCAQFETFSKSRHTNQEHQQPRFDLNKTNKRPREDLSNCQHFYHPMGVKKSLFVDNDGGNVCEVFFMLLHGPGMGRLVYSTKYKFLFKLTQLMKYLSFLGLDNKFSLKYSPYLVGIQAKFF